MGRDPREMKRQGTEGGTVDAVPVVESEREEDADTSVALKASGAVVQYGGATEPSNSDSHQTCK